MINDQSIQFTGYASVDKPWLKYFSEEAINCSLVEYSLYEYLWECNKDNLDNFALNYFGHKITYRRLFAMIDEAARAFIEIGIQEGDIVPVVTVSTVTSVVCFYALNRIGAVSDYLNVLSEEKDFGRLFDEVSAKVVVTLDLFQEKVVRAAEKSGVKKIITMSVNQEMPNVMNIGYRLKTRGKISLPASSLHILPWKDFLGYSKKVKVINRHKNPKNPCMIAHTGGTTGVPKGVILDDCAMNAVVAQQRSIYKNLPAYKRGATFLQVIVPFVVYGILTCTHMPLCMGWCLALIPKFEEGEWHNYFKKYRFSYVFAVPSYVISMIDNPKMKNMDLSGLKIIAAGGDGITDALEKDMNEFLALHGSSAQLEKGYGMTEVCAAGLVTFPSCNKIGSVGVPLPKNNMMIYDNEADKELMYNEIGEVCLNCPSCMQGYMNSVAEMNSLFKVHNDGVRWLHTGDLGYITEDGFLFLVGRVKRIIMTTGNGVTYKVFPNIVESVLDTNECVLHSCVVGVQNGEDRVLCAHIVVGAGEICYSDKIEKELRELCDTQLPSYERPTFYRFCERLPLTDAGKVDYRTLEECC